MGKRESAAEDSGPRISADGDAERSGVSDVGAWRALASATQAVATGRVAPATVARARALARPHRRLIAGYLWLTTLTATLAVTSPIVAGVTIDAIVSGSPRRTVLLLGVGIALVSVADAALGLWSDLKSAQLGSKVVFDLRCQVYEHVQRLPLAFFKRTRTGSLVSRLNGDVVEAQRAFTSALSGVVGNTVTLVLTGVVMAVLSWEITLLALMLVPLFLIPARRQGARVGLLQREVMEQYAGITSQMTERFSPSGATLVKLTGQARDDAAVFRRRASALRDVNVRSMVAAQAFIRVLTLMSGLALAVIYGLGGSLAVEGRLEAGTIVTMALLLSRLYGPLTALATARLDVVVTLLAFERIFEVLDIEPSIRESAQPKTVPRGPVSVEFDRVHFRYGDSQPFLGARPGLGICSDAVAAEPLVLRDLSFDIEPGQTVAIVGPSGAGKSTIASLLARLHDVNGGSIRIAGIDVRDLSFDSLRATIGVVSQDCHLLHDTIAVNLRFAAPDATDDDLWRVLREARIDVMVRGLPDGTDTVIGEHGYRLSGGERQRLTIARLLLARPRVVVLDEATAHLDSESEAAIQAVLKDVLVDRTALVIAHRLSTVRTADRILFVDRGKVVEDGTHDELMARDGRFAALHRAALVATGNRVGRSSNSERCSHGGVSRR